MPKPHPEMQQEGFSSIDRDICCLNFPNMYIIKSLTLSQLTQVKCSAYL